MARFQIVDETCIYDSRDNVYIPIDVDRQGRETRVNPDWAEILEKKALNRIEVLEEKLAGDGSPVADRRARLEARLANLKARFK